MDFENDTPRLNSAKAGPSHTEETTAELFLPDSGLEKELTIYQHNGMCLIVELMHFELCGRVVVLSVTQFRVMQLLMSEPERVFTRDEILEWLALYRKKVSTQDERSADTIVKLLRKAVRPKGATEPNHQDVVVTVHGRGYRLSKRRKS